MKVDILVGIDFYYSLVSGRLVRDSEGPVAIESSLGWILSDGLSVLLDIHCHLNIHSFFDSELRTQLDRFWEIESVGGSDDCVMHQFEKDIQFNGKRYVTKLPSKTNHEMLSDNFDIATKRLKGLLKRVN